MVPPVPLEARDPERGEPPKGLELLAEASEPARRRFQDLRKAERGGALHDARRERLFRRLVFLPALRDAGSSPGPGRGRLDGRPRKGPRVRQERPGRGGLLGALLVERKALL